MYMNSISGFAVELGFSSYSDKYFMLLLNLTEKY